MLIKLESQLGPIVFSPCQNKSNVVLSLYCLARPKTRFTYLSLQQLGLIPSCCRTPVLGLGLGVDIVFAKNGQSLRNRMAEPLRPMAEPPQPEPSPKWLKWTYVDEG